MMSRKVYIYSFIAFVAAFLVGVPAFMTAANGRSAQELAALEPAAGVAGPRLDADMIEGKFQTMATLMNDRQATQDAAAFFDSYVSPDAVFEMTADNPTIEQDIELTFGKNDYINSYIMGTNFVEDYQMDIKTVSVEISDDGKEAVSKEVITEQGVSTNPMEQNSQGQFFVSTTTCETHHALEGNKPVSTGGKCHTTTSLQDAI